MSLHPYTFLRHRLTRLAWQVRTPDRRWRLKRWFFLTPFTVNRAKVCVAVAAGVLTIASFNHQVASQATESRRNQCIARVDSRSDLRSVLLYVVDLSDVLPLSSYASNYTMRRTDYINSAFPALNPDDC